jgi:hypothetical protein
MRELIEMEAKSMDFDNTVDMTPSIVQHKLLATMYHNLQKWEIERSSKVSVIKRCDPLFCTLSLQKLNYGSFW